MRRGNDNPRMSRLRIQTVMAALAMASLTMAALAVAALPTPAMAQGCAMCATALKDSHDPLARSMASSIYFMLSMPFALFTTVGGWLFWRHRRAGRPNANQTTNQTSTRGVMPEENPS